MDDFQLALETLDELQKHVLNQELYKSLYCLTGASLRGLRRGLPLPVVTVAVDVAVPEVYYSSPTHHFHSSLPSKINFEHPLGRHTKTLIIQHHTDSYLSLIHI